MLASDDDWQDGSMDAAEWCRVMQDRCLDAGDEKGALAYYELAKLWIKRRDEKNSNI